MGSEVISDRFDTLPASRRPTRVYVAAAKEDYARARAVMVLLRQLGAEITHDWTYEVEEGGPSDWAAWRSYATLDLEGVRGADVVLCLTPGVRSKGCGLYAELGMGVVLGKRVVVTGRMRDRCIFAHLATRVRTDIEGVNACLTT